jgi:serine/threonine-protein kinase RsbW
MAALICNFARYQLCLISPEGFSPEALEILRQQKALGMSRGQIKLLVKLLSADKVIPETPNPNEFEMVLPMGEDTEMIAAHTVEKIARRHNFQPKAITQIKTALVEACINATEHSLSLDRKIYQKFTVADDKLVITISNRGVKIPAEKLAQMNEQIESENGRRGWGLKLMRTLMDEVKFEQVDDGTQISMVKYLNGKK